MLGSKLYEVGVFTDFMCIMLHSGDLETLFHAFFTGNYSVVQHYERDDTFLLHAIGKTAYEVHPFGFRHD